MPQILQIDRSVPFNPQVAWGWTEIDEQDDRSLALTELDLEQVELLEMCYDGENGISGEERILRVCLERGDCVRLDAMILMALWEQKPLIPASWMKEGQYIMFDGMVLLNTGEDRCVLFLACVKGEATWYAFPLKYKLPRGCLSAVIKIG